VSTHHLVSARQILAALGAGMLLVAGAAACGSSTPTNASAATEQGSSQNSGQGQTGSQQTRFPGANGLIAAVEGSTAQVQSQQDGQVAVTWNGSTTFTKQVSAKLSDVKVGSCVVVAPAAPASTGGAGGASSTATTAPTTVAATTVRISPKGTDGSCSGSFGGAGGGTRPQFNGQAGGSGGFSGGSQPPQGAGSRQIFRGFGGAFGEVTSVGANSLVVKASTPQFSQTGGTPTTTTRNVTVTVTKTTTYTTTGKGAASDVKVGQCMRAQGSSDSTGAVTAKTVQISAATNGACSTTFARGAGAGGPGGFSQGS
jgi:hypothetical protein